MINKEKVIAFIREKSGRPLSFKDIVHFMGLGRPEARELKRLLREMLHSGEVVQTRKGLYGPAEEMNLVRGYFEAHRDGYGFVISEKPGERDVFIPARGTLGAMNNDRVIVSVGNWRKREGRIIRILDRAYTRVAGRLDVTKTAIYVRPKSKMIPFDLYIAPKDSGGAKHNDNVIAEIISYPTEKRPPAGKVVKIIEKPGDPKSEIDAIIEELNLSGRFPKAVTDEARMMKQDMGECPAGGRTCGPCVL